MRVRPGKQTVAGSIITPDTFFRGDLVMKNEKKLYDYSLLSADSRMAVVSYWPKNVHQVLVNCLGGLPRNSVDWLTDRARNDLKCVKGP